MVGLAFVRRRSVGHIRRQADAARDKREYMKAALFCEKVLSHAPDDAAIHVQCGHMFKEVGELDGPSSTTVRRVCLYRTIPI
jgi:hypothetical protein